MTSLVATAAALIFAAVTASFLSFPSRTEALASLSAVTAAFFSFGVVTAPFFSCDVPTLLFGTASTAAVSRPTERDAEREAGDDECRRRMTAQQSSHGSSFEIVVI